MAETDAGTRLQNPKALRNRICSARVSHGVRRSAMRSHIAFSSMSHLASAVCI